MNLRQCSSGSPQWRPRTLGLGNALALEGRNQEALERYEQALAYNPRLPEGEYAAGFALAQLGQSE